MAKTHLRDWSSKSYGRDGRAASAIFDEGQSSQGWTRAQEVTDHLADCRQPGQHGAPSFEQRDARNVQGPQAKPVKAGHE